MAILAFTSVRTSWHRRWVYILLLVPTTDRSCRLHSRWLKWHLLHLSYCNGIPSIVTDIMAGSVHHDLNRASGQLYSTRKLVPLYDLNVARTTQNVWFSIGFSFAPLSSGEVALYADGTNTLWCMSSNGVIASQARATFQFILPPIFCCNREVQCRQKKWDSEYVCKFLNI